MKKGFTVWDSIKESTLSKETTKTSKSVNNLVGIIHFIFSRDVFRKGRTGTPSGLGVLFWTMPWKWSNYFFKLFVQGLVPCICCLWEGAWEGPLHSAQLDSWIIASPFSGTVSEKFAHFIANLANTFCWIWWEKIFKLNGQKRLRTSRLLRTLTFHWLTALKQRSTNGVWNKLLSLTNRMEKSIYNKEFRVK